VSQPNLPSPIGPDSRPLAQRVDALAHPSSRDALARIALGAIEHYVAVLDLDGTVLEVNDRGFVALPRPRNEIIDQPLWDTPPWRENPSAQTQLHNYFDRARGGTVVRETLSLQHRDVASALEIEVPVEILLTPVITAAANAGAAESPAEPGRVAFVVVEAVHVVERNSLRGALTDRSRALAESVRFQLAHLPLRTPLVPFSTISTTPVTGVEITGSFIAIASMTALGVMSLRPSSATTQGSTKTSAER